MIVGKARVAVGRVPGDAKLQSDGQSQKAVGGVKDAVKSKCVGCGLLARLLVGLFGPKRRLDGGLHEFADQALIGDATGGSLGLNGAQQRFGDAHVDAG